MSITKRFGLFIVQAFLTATVATAAAVTDDTKEKTAQSARPTKTQRPQRIAPADALKQFSLASRGWRIVDDRIEGKFTDNDKATKIISKEHISFSRSLEFGYTVKSKWYHGVVLKAGNDVYICSVGHWRNGGLYLDGPAGKRRFMDEDAIRVTAPGQWHTLKVSVNVSEIAYYYDGKKIGGDTFKGAGSSKKQISIGFLGFNSQVAAKDFYYVADSPSRPPADEAQADASVLTNLTIDALSKQLVKTPADMALLESLRSEMEGMTDVDEKVRLGVIYYLGCVQTDQKKEAEFQLTSLRKQHPSNLNMKFLSARYLSDACSGCKGSGVKYRDCPKCGSGKCKSCGGGRTRTSKGFSGETRTLKCLSCMGSGKCEDCNGKGKFRETCPICKGARRKHSREQIRKTYLALLRGKTKELDQQIAAAAAKENDVQEGKTSGRPAGWNAATFCNTIGVAYDDNTIAADRKYKNKSIPVSGFITGIVRTPIMGQPCVILEGNYRFYFNAKDEERLGKLQVADALVIKATCVGLWGRAVHFRDCVIIKECTYNEMMRGRR